MAAVGAPQILAPPVVPADVVKPFVRVPAGRIALTHVRVVDGTGVQPRENRTLLINDGRIAIEQSSDDPVPDGTSQIDLTGKTVLPGLVGMHNHMFYVAAPNSDAQGKWEEPLLIPQMTFSAPRLYLANGVTTLRTTGSVEPYADLNLKREIDAGRIPGPHMDVTGPYLEGTNSYFIQMHQLTGPDDARRSVAFWADQGVTSFKAYMNITKAELRAAIKEAHRRGLKITGHLCSVTYPEAAALGIDNLEHGFWENTQLEPGKEPDKCPQDQGEATLATMDPAGPQARALIQDLIAHHVAVTSTLPVLESNSPNYQTLPQRQLEMFSAPVREDYFYVRALIAARKPERRESRAHLWANELRMERAFAAAGGLLLTGPDPTGGGDVIPGFADLHGIELLVEAGFSPVEAIRIATLNGATYLGVADRIGTIAAGKNADFFIVMGDPSKTIADIRNVEIVFKDGIGYDTGKLLDSVRGRYGEY